MAVRTFTAVIYWEAGEDSEPGVYVAECPEIGTASQGDTIEEAMANLREATELYLEETSASGNRHPFVTTFEVEVAEAASSHS
jgi:predicted RNase H-like HicB family nuclease